MPRLTTNAFTTNHDTTLVLALGARAFGVLALSMLESLANLGAIAHHLGHLLATDRLAQRKLGWWLDCCRSYCGGLARLCLGSPGHRMWYPMGITCHTGLLDDLPQGLG